MVTLSPCFHVALEPRGIQSSLASRITAEECAHTPFSSLPCACTAHAVRTHHKVTTLLSLRSWIHSCFRGRSSTEVLQDPSRDAVAAKMKYSVCFLWRQIRRPQHLEPILFLQLFQIQTHMLLLETEAHQAGETVLYPSVSRRMQGQTGKSCGKHTCSGLRPLHCPGREASLSCGAAFCTAWLEVLGAGRLRASKITLLPPLYLLIPWTQGNFAQSTKLVT